MIRFSLFISTLLASMLVNAQNDSLKTNLPTATFEIFGGMGTGNYNIKNQPSLNGNSTTLGANIMYRVSKTFDLGIGYYATTFNANTMIASEWSEIKRNSSLIPVQVRAHFDIFNTYNSPFDFYVGIGAGPSFAIRETFDNGISSFTDKSQKTTWKMLINLGLNIKLTKESFFTINYMAFADLNSTKYNNVERKLNTGTINLGFGLIY